MLHFELVQPMLLNKLTEDLGVTHGTILIVMILSYFIIKWAVRNGIEEAYTAITGEKTAESKKIEEMMKKDGVCAEDAADC
ncbi:DUF6019 family protein [Ruminococcus sp.]|uniref:DUF6019 family protein n=1 Tax=Ruminococcus sp. TaxID=41978 RepID=UPI0025FCC20F|nr:DUF6019 family protein [Ruminococcus sp.]